MLSTLLTALLKAVAGFWDGVQRALGGAQQRIADDEAAQRVQKRMDAAAAAAPLTKQDVIDTLKKGDI